MGSACLETGVRVWNPREFSINCHALGSFVRPRVGHGYTDDATRRPEGLKSLGLGQGTRSLGDLTHYDSKISVVVIRDSTRNKRLGSESSEPR